MGFDRLSGESLGRVRDLEIAFLSVFAVDGQYSPLSFGNYGLGSIVEMHSTGSASAFVGRSANSNAWDAAQSPAHAVMTILSYHTWWHNF